VGELFAFHAFMQAVSTRRREARVTGNDIDTGESPPKSMSNPFFTIGHSTRPIDEFVALLTTAEVRLVVDVRTVPRSRTNPQFSRDALPASLVAHGIAYEHLAALGGLRGKQLGVNSDVNAFWTNASFHNYADYALSE
jgi:hypothetical protein